MATLPLRPLIFVPFFLLLLFGPVFVAPADRLESITDVIGPLAYLLYLGWLYGAVAFIANLPEPRKRGQSLRYRSTARALLIIAAGCLFYAAIYNLYLHRYIDDTSLEFYIGTSNSLLVLPAGIACLGVLWYAARALREAEAQTTLPASYVATTFFLLCYVPFTTPFIYNRLKRLTSEPQEFHPARDTA